VEGRQQGLGLHLGQHLAALGQHAFDQQARALESGLARVDSGGGVCCSSCWFW
jgi:hypothetical protein